MAAHAIQGLSGTFSYVGHVARIMSWELTSVQDINDASGFGGSGNWRQNLPGMKGWRVRASGYVTEGAASSAPAADFSASNDSNQTGIALTLGLDGVTSQYTGTAFPAQFVVGQGINGNATFSAELVGTGALVELIMTT